MKTTFWNKRDTVLPLQRCKSLLQYPPRLFHLPDFLLVSRVRLAGSSDNPVVTALAAPGLALQKLVTREPDEQMAEVAIRAVEAAVARFWEASKLGGVFRMKKRKTVAVLGADLFTLLLAGELEKKAYPITVFCEQGDLESYLRACAPFLRDVSFALELKRLKGKDIKFEL